MWKTIAISFDIVLVRKAPLFQPHGELSESFIIDSRSHFLVLGLLYGATIIDLTDVFLGRF